MSGPVKYYIESKNETKYLHIIRYLTVWEHNAPNVCKHSFTSIDSSILHAGNSFLSVVRKNSNIVKF